MLRRSLPRGSKTWSPYRHRLRPAGRLDEALAQVQQVTLDLRLARPAQVVARDVAANDELVVVDGPLRAGDDALDARFVDRAAMAALPLVDGLLDALTEWDALPRC